MSKTLEMVTITREQAETWLGATDLQRRLRKPAIANLKADMQAGNWHPELAPPILIDKKTGGVINGQHRLRAFLETKKQTLDSYVDHVDRRAIQVVDTGTTRNLADTLQIRGHEHPTHKSAWLHRSIQWVTGDKASRILTRSRQVEIIEAAPHADKAAAMAYQLKYVGQHAKVYNPPTGVVSALWDMQQYGVGGDWVEEFIRRLSSSEDMDSLLARTQAKLVEAVNPKRKATLTPDSQSYLIARSFNAWINEEEISRLYARRAAIKELPGYQEWVEANFAPFLEL